MAAPSCIRQRLEEALESWVQSIGINIPLSKEADRALLVNNLTLMAKYEPGGVKRAFRTPGRETTQKELSQIADRGSALAMKLRNPKCSTTRAREQLAKRLEEMHATTINALATSPGVLDIGRVRRELPRLLRDESADRGQLANVLDRLGQVAVKATAPDTTDEGRWPDRRAQEVANFLAHFYQDVTGRPPTIRTHIDEMHHGEPYGPFLDLVTEIFRVMGLGADACSYARRAAGLRRLS